MSYPIYKYWNIDRSLYYFWFPRKCFFFFLFQQYGNCYKLTFLEKPIVFFFFSNAMIFYTISTIIMYTARACERFGAEKSHHRFRIYYAFEDRSSAPCAARGLIINAVFSSTLHLLKVTPTSSPRPLTFCTISRSFTLIQTARRRRRRRRSLFIRRISFRRHRSARYY